MLSAEMASLLALVQENPVPRPDSVHQWRAAVDEQLSGPLVEGTTERLMSLGGRPAATIQPFDSTSERTVLYLHGGAYEVGSISAYRSFASQLALDLDAAVIVLDYRLAPEHPFPAAVDDVVAGYRDLLAAGTDPRHIVVMGDSAGGGLTVAALLAFAREDIAGPVAAVCLSPWADLTMTADSYARCATTDPFLDRDTLGRSAQSYLAGAEPRHALASPIFAGAELGGLAPILIQAAAGEVLADDAATLAARIGDAGGQVELELWPDLTHVWHLLGPGIPEARNAVDHVRRFIEAHAAPSPD